MPVLASVLSFPELSLLPILVFFAELCVVTLGTMRIIFISRGMRLLAPMIGFFEIIIWLFAVSQVMQNLHNPSCFLGFACGFTLGNYLGLRIEGWLALGTVVVRTITHRDPTDLLAGLKSADFGVTSLDAQGAKGPVKMVFTIVRRKELDRVTALIREFDAQAFYSVDDIQESESGVFPKLPPRRGLLPLVLQPFRKTA